eukprot:s6170_g3.t1
MAELHKQRLGTPGAIDAPRVLAGQRRKHDCLGNKLTRRRQDCPRHEQLKELLPHLPPDPPRLSRSVRRARAELAAQHSERERLKVEEQRREARRRLCLCRFRAIGFAVLRRLRDEDEEFLEAVRTNPVMPMTPCTSEEGLEEAGPGPKLFEHRLKQARRRKASTSGRNAQREELATRGNFRADFIDDLVIKPRIETQPLLAFMDQGEAAAIVQKGSKSSKSSRQKESSPGARGAAPEEGQESKDAQSDAKAPGPTAAAKIAARRVKLQRMLDVLDPGASRAAEAPASLLLTQAELSPNSSVSTSFFKNLSTNSFTCVPS